VKSDGREIGARSRGIHDKHEQLCGEEEEDIIKTVFSLTDDVC